MRVDRVSGAVQELAAGDTSIGVVAVNGDRVLAASGGELIDVRKDGTDLRRVQVDSGLLDALTPTGDGTVYAVNKSRGADDAAGDQIRRITPKTN